MARTAGDAAHRAIRVPAEALAGLTLAAVGIPEVLGYAKIAGMPLVTGLYTMLLPMAAFAVLGSSRHLVVAADSATAAILAAALTGLAAAGFGSTSQWPCGRACDSSASASMTGLRFRWPLFVREVFLTVVVIR